MQHAFTLMYAIYLGCTFLPQFGLAHLFVLLAAMDNRVVVMRPMEGY